MQRSAFYLDESTLGIDYILSRRPITTVSMAEALGASGEAVVEQLAKVDAEIGKMKRELEAGPSSDDS